MATIIRMTCLLRMFGVPDAATRALAIALLPSILSGFALGASAPTTPASAPSTQPTSLPASQPATMPAEWGTAVAGLALGAELAGPAVLGEKLVFRLGMRNVGAVAVRLGEAREAFAWLFVTQGRDKSCFSEKVLFARNAADWPAELAGGAAVALKPITLKSPRAWRFQRGMKYTEGYPAPADGAALGASDGTLDELLSIGRARARWVVFLPARGPDEAAMILTSNAFDMLIAPPDAKTMSPAVRKALLADLSEQFDRDAWSAQSAHALAVRLGEGILDDLNAMAGERKRPEHSRLWLATAVADIRDARAADALAGLLDDSLASVRCVVAYHGPKQRSEKLDKAIVAKAAGAKEDRFTAYALLGFLVFRGEAPAELLSAGLGSDDPRARTAAARAISGMASEQNLRRLTELLNDKDERVRQAARKAVAAMTQPAGE